MAVLIQEDPRGFATVLLDDPEKRNAIDHAAVTALRSALEDATGTVVILGTTDPRAFSSGAGLHLGDAERARVSDSLYELYLAMRRSPKVVVAAAAGHAVGAGAQLLIASDVRFSSPDLQVRFLGPGHGLVVGAWGLPEIVGRGRALEICGSMRIVSAEEALAIGLVDRIALDPLLAAREFAAGLCDLDPRVVQNLKQIASITNPLLALERERESNSRWSGQIEGWPRD